ncbi:hypothetical protein [Oscillatoria acuminata]|uniref:Nucleotidyltransferase family protein n=1 Tax=Oscillatoria acuminata PCC 6304 TaxID=56110 RepID=K9TFA6_9CYAN|nr:hypothetical protein [Oscillatoria acuminata]AFY81215.1 hypothetical protein Oscil6304_1510 [Oscillatoria acuminata PCC 6304]
MTKILPLGHLFPTNQEGFILNDCHPDKILPPWTSLVEELCQTCLQIWPSRLQALYLRGSVPRGLAILNGSDLDSFALLSGEITPQDIEQSRQLCQTLKRRYLFCKKVELILFNDRLIHNTNSIWPVIIQTESLQIAGNFIPKTLKVKPGPDLISYSYTWKSDLANTLKSLECLSPRALDYSNQVKKQCAWIARRLIRVGFELVMEQDQCYTPDLYQCYQRFSAYFPEQKKSMKKALELAINPSANRAGLIIFLRRFGRWLEGEVHRKFYSSIEEEPSTNKIP